MSTTEPSPAARAGLSRWRWPVAGAIVVVAAGICAWAQFSDSFDHQEKFLTTAPTIAGAAILLGAWLVLTAPWSWTAGLLTLGGVAAVLGGLWFSVRIDETSGDVVPIRFAWRWSPKPDVALVGELANLAEAEASVQSSGVEDYAQFLGPDRRGTVPGPQLDDDWTKHPPREIWRRPIGAGWSGFAIVGDYAFTQEQRGDDEYVVCYDLDTGEPVWSFAEPGRFEETLAGVGPRATPTVHEGRVYALSALGVLNCLDADTGERIWRHDILKENETPDGQLTWGRSGSPLIVGDLVVVSAGGPKGRSLVAYQKETGDLMWHAGDDPSSYSSPHFATLAGIPQIVIVNQQSVVGHDPESGAILWRFEWPGENPKCSQPVVVDDEMVLVSAGYGLGSALLRVAIGPPPPREGDDGDEPLEDPAADVGDDEIRIEQLWQQRNLRNLKSKFANMVLHDGFLYALDDGVLACIEPVMGTRRWKGGRYGHGQLLLVGNRLLVLGEKGELALVKPNPREFVELGRIQALPGKTWNTLAISGRRLLLRNHEEAVSYELAVSEDAEQPGEDSQPNVAQPSEDAQPEAAQAEARKPQSATNGDGAAQPEGVTEAGDTTPDAAPSNQAKPDGAQPDAAREPE